MKARLPQNWAVKGTGSKIEMKPVVRYIYDNTGAWFQGSELGYYGIDNNKSMYSFSSDELGDRIVFLTLSEFIELSREEVSDGQSISRENFKEIVDIACSNWKKILVDFASKDSDPLSSTLVLSKDFVSDMFKAATKEQLPVLKKHLKYVEEDNIAIIKGVSFRQDIANLSHKIIGDSNAIAVLCGAATKPEYTGRGLFVSGNFEVVINDTELGGTEIVFLKRK